MNKILFALIAVLAFASCTSPTGTAPAPVATANAGADQTANVFDTVNLIGSGNADSYSWCIVDPTGATVGTASVTSTSFTPGKMGTFVATLTTTLGGTTATDTVNVVVSNPLVGIWSATQTITTVTPNIITNYTLTIAADGTYSFRSIQSAPSIDTTFSGTWVCLSANRLAFTQVSSTGNTSRNGMVGTYDYDASLSKFTYDSLASTGTVLLYTGQFTKK